MTSPKKKNDPSDRLKRGAARQEAHLEGAEDHLEEAARRTEASFYERTAKPEADLEEAEDHLEKTAHSAEEAFYKRNAKPEADLEAAEAHLEKSAGKADALGVEGRRGSR